MKTLNNRFKKIREARSITQQQFADKLKLSRNFVAQIEMGTKKPSERTINDICREFDVNENWLRNGTGEMFIKKSKDTQISDMLSDVLKSDEKDFKRRLISALAKLDDKDWETLENLIDSISKK